MPRVARHAVRGPAPLAKAVPEISGWYYPPAYEAARRVWCDGRPELFHQPPRVLTTLLRMVSLRLALGASPAHADGVIKIRRLGARRILQGDKKLKPK